MPSSDTAQNRLEALQRENQRLRRAVDELSTLNELATAIGASHDLDEIMQTIVRRSLRAVQAEQGVITLVDEGASDPMKTLVRTMSSSSERSPFHPDQHVLGWMHLNKRPLCINDPQHDERFRGTSWDPSIRSVLCAPLMVRSTLTGIITLYNKKAASGFTDEDQRLLAIIAAQSAQVIENARLYEEEKALLRMQEEVRLAREIQTNLLPTQPPEVPGYDLAGTSVPAETVGGDYFDFIPVEEHRLALCVGDVSGKGLPASLLMANVQATLRGQTLGGRSARACLEHSNRLLCQSIRKGSFVTLFYGLLDVEQHTFQYANAGHNRPLLLSADGNLKPLEMGDLVLGALPDLSYREAVLHFQPGDLLLVYSDGIVEAMNEAREQFGDERLASTLQAHGHEPAPAVVDHILEAARQHAGSAPQTDDMTLLVIKRRS